MSWLHNRSVLRGYGIAPRVAVLGVVVLVGMGRTSGSLDQRVTDEVATESLTPWSTHYIPDLSLSEDAKVGRYSLVGTFPFNHHIILAAPPARSWNLTKYEKMRFWVKADRRNENLLVMLCTRGFENRRDAVVSLTTEWKLHELPFDEKTFWYNAQGDFSFTRVRSLIFYNNSGFETKIWLDGLEFIGERPGQPVEASELKVPPDGSAKVLSLTLTDPSPHLEEAQQGRQERDPRYDLPPIAFNKANAFRDALIHFDQVRDWKALARDADGYLCLSKDQSLQGVSNLKVELTPAGKRPRITLLPPEPIRVNHDFDVVECWAYAHKAGGEIAFHFRRKDGSMLVAGSDSSDGWDGVNPKPMSEFWNLVRVVLPEKVERGAELVALHVTPNLPEGYKDPTYLLYFDQLRVLLFRDCLRQPAPAFKHTGPVVDRFPVHPDGACPKTREPVRTVVKKQGAVYHFTYTTRAGEELTYRYTPRTGTLSDLEIRPKGKSPFRPADGSGPAFDFNGKEYDATSPLVRDGSAVPKLISQRLDGQTVKVAWRYGDQAETETITYEFSLKGKTLRIGAHSQERHLAKWYFGQAKGVKEARVIEVPFMLYSPNVLLADGLFVTYYTDWYGSNVSMMPYGAESYVKGDAAGYTWQPRRDHPMAGYAYFKRTDGRRHPFQEVSYITASADFDDVMLTVSNPPSPMKEVLKKRLYRMVLSSRPGIFKDARAFVDLCDRYGMTNFYFLFHAPLWFKRYTGCEAFPGDLHVSMLHEPEGGDRGLQELFRYMRDKGVVPGYYDGFPARDVTGPNFHYGWTAYGPNGEWKQMWRSPALKPWAFPELAATLYRERARRYGTRVVYQDGITSWIISYMNEYDHRYPHSGTLRETMKALATGWQRCRENVNGPVFSEGRGSDFYTAGLNDGDYSKLKGYWDEKPCTEDRVELLVDFRLRKLGPLSAPVSLNIGYAGFAATNKISYESWYAQEESYAHLHHFLAAQIAFATIGMLEPYWPIWPDPKFHFDKTMTCYFMIQQLQERYIMEPVGEITYLDGKQLLSVSDALRANVVKDNMVCIRYRNGLMIHVNLNWDGKPWQVAARGKTYDLPPGGWLAEQGKDFVEFSALVDGGRVDFVNSPAYVYLHGHGKPVEVDGYKTDRQWVKWKQGLKAGREISFPESQR